MKSLGPIMTRCMKQNNTIDIYEEYFDADLQVRRDLRACLPHMPQQCRRHRLM